MEAGRAAGLVSVLPGADVHEPPGVELPSIGAGATVPVVLPVTVPTMVTGMAVGRVDGRVGLVLAVGADSPDMPVMAPIAVIAAGAIGETLVLVEVTLATDGDSSTSVGAQFKLVPGIVGSCASGGEASVVTGAPGTVVAENRLVNGPGPASGDDTIAPGVVGIPIPVVPTVETCARQLPELSSNRAVAQMY